MSANAFDQRSTDRHEPRYGKRSKKRPDPVFERAEARFDDSAVTLRFLARLT